MSDAQLSKLKEDRDALAREVNLLQAAIKVEDASDRVVAQLRKAEVSATPAAHHTATAAQPAMPHHTTPHHTALLVGSPCPPRCVALQDPFCLPSENDWNTASDQGACSCVIS